MGKIYERAQKYIDQVSPGDIVEVGIGRDGDDNSTFILANWAKSINCQLHAVDIDPRWCNQMHQHNLTNIQIHNMSGQDYLNKFLGVISILYLDNFDWDWHPESSEQFVLDQQEHYRASLGLDMNNINCQMAHLQQAQAAVEHMAERSVVILDDTFWNPAWGVWTGKSGAGILVFLEHGFTVVETEEYPVYGTILTRGITNGN
jgi:hypothetical protein